MNHRHEALWPLKNYKLYSMCALILSNPLHLIVGSRLIFIQNELWVLNCCHAIFFLVFRITKRYHQDFSLLRIIIFVIHHLFWWKMVHLYCAFTHIHIFPKIDAKFDWIIKWRRNNETWTYSKKFSSIWLYGGKRTKSNK